MIGLVCVAGSFLFVDNLYMTLMLFSVGNALYHVGAGSLVLTLPDKKATFSGIYVAPGAMGLAIGTSLRLQERISRSSYFHRVDGVVRIGVCGWHAKFHSNQTGVNWR